ncbi:uncharacterized protein A1O5_07541 [Cladophialophora psammophila CBS 110553]|uniref:Uncharacterized protein n=1 Tax=Cladophialophora psammophila CBS 110553 TaxID=1182543 RepID=W9WWS6_9EURO|nr:uncharacterized protein A1O5_07541 [Cladophialophora psammophila CBS 110553]EXJ69505.1 hypothetical protein A1O5_07541 [Cladophialophora psammophila CBS 110553]
MPPVGIIITVTVLVAASIAAYENPQVRAWIDRTRHRIAMGLYSLGDEIGPRPRPRRTSTDASMHEEKGELAEERRRQAIAEIMERGRIMEERRKRRRLAEQEKEIPSSPTFDNLVDKDGVLLQPAQDEQSIPAAHSSGVDPLAQPAALRQRPFPSYQEQLPSLPPQSMDAPCSVRQFNESQPNQFESRYEREMREAWNLPLSGRAIEILSSHASESLIELTPTTEGVPDPDFSIPSAEYFNRPLERSEYFSAAGSDSTHTLSDHESQASLPVQSTYLDVPQNVIANRFPLDATPPASLTPSIAGSASSIHASEAEESSDDILSDFADAIRTPSSAWTDVDSTVSGDFHL